MCYNQEWLMSKIVLVTIIIFITLNYVIRSYNTKPFIFRGYKMIGEHRFKNILLWNPFFDRDDYYFGLGQQPFIDAKCEVIDCYVMKNKDALPMKEFDAILFHGPEFDPTSFDVKRFPEQLFIYFSMESPLNRPANVVDNYFFNLTMTHRMDSDVSVNYFQFIDFDGNQVSPSKSPRWNITENTNEELLNIHKKKTKAAAWFCSNCQSHSGREERVAELQKYLQVDVYGLCGPYECPRTEEKKCLEMLRSDYFFYLSYENSICKDYITEKAINPYEYDTIPVIFSGANLTEYLPPNSYLDATEMSISELAAKMKYLIDNPNEYIKYFWWKKYYLPNSKLNINDSFCQLCKILNDKKVHKVYNDFVSWWHGTAEQPTCYSL